MKTYTIEQICRDLVGPIRPIGEPEVDNARYANLQEHLQIVNRLLGDVIDVFTQSYGATHTKLRASRSAVEYLDSVYNLLGEVLER